MLPRVVSALHYDVPRGTTSVGTHVRDAACYVCWAFARAFDAAVMAPHVAQLAQSHLVASRSKTETRVRQTAVFLFLGAAAARRRHVLKTKFACAKSPYFFFRRSRCSSSSRSTAR